LPHKIPVSTLIVVHTPELRVLLIERADAPGYWQSVTGSQEAGETLAATATRELAEETGIDADRYGGVRDWKMSNVYEIYARWRYRYAPGVTHNTEHVFGLEVPDELPVVLEPREHRAYAWLPVAAAADKCFSWSNRDAILRLPQMAAARR
jgi:dATP pyrophosphohydrolase